MSGVYEVTLKVTLEEDGSDIENWDWPAVFKAVGWVGEYELVSVKDFWQPSEGRWRVSREDWVRMGLADDKAEQPVTGWVSIVFMQGDEGHDVVNRLMRWDGNAVLKGATDLTIAAAVAHLKQWDYGDESEYNITAEPQWGSRDQTAECDGYTLAWNSGLGYVSLNRKVGAE